LAFAADPKRKWLMKYSAYHWVPEKIPKKTANSQLVGGFNPLEKY